MTNNETKNKGATMHTDTKEKDPIFGEVIFSYTREQAISDGVLVNVTPTAKEAGILFPVAVTRAVWDKCIEVPEGCEGNQDRAGREWDVLYLLRIAIQRGIKSSSQLFFTVDVKTGPHTHQEMKLKSVVGPGDNMEPVITVMFPEED